MTERTKQAQDPIASAAHAELDAIQRRIEENWDLEARLREILLEEHYHDFVEERSRSFDANTALAAILSDEAVLGPLRMVQWTISSDMSITSQIKVLLYARMRHEEPEATTDPVDQVRQVAGEMAITLLEVKEAETTALTSDYTLAVAGAHHQAWQLYDLAEALDERLIGKEDALVVLNETADALLSLYEALDNEDHSSVTNPEFFKDRVWTLGTITNLLKPAILRLFDPSDDTVGSLL
ncbi:hypothetical protein [Micromonospora carbonacea]|uniref:hypothetical protein n=1 Tax=Micromonospora carbonacea TaxID=47853 RepID=UPI0033E73F49